MAGSRHPRRGRRTTIAAAVTAAILTTAGLATGCDAVDRTLDCVRTADTIADSVTRLQQAVENTSGDPRRINTTLDTIDTDLDRIRDQTDDADVENAVTDLRTAVDHVRTDVDNGDTSPDLGPVTDAAGELTKVCTP
ncbi:hypothetical protein ACL02U_16095 [Streptomyces sp. MS06]|uniref:hypothetical protein n=1 Tax=Streptomyces sp. MS06 TaxID=3385974 RepID=UPI0039A3DBDE